MKIFKTGFFLKTLLLSISRSIRNTIHKKDLKSALVVVLVQLKFTLGWAT